MPVLNLRSRSSKAASPAPPQSPKASTTFPTSKLGPNLTSQQTQPPVAQLPTLEIDSPSSETKRSSPAGSRIGGSLRRVSGKLGLGRKDSIKSTVKEEEGGKGTSGKESKVPGVSGLAEPAAGRMTRSKTASSTTSRQQSPQRSPVASPRSYPPPSISVSRNALPSKPSRSSSSNRLNPEPLSVPSPQAQHRPLQTAVDPTASPSPIPRSASSKSRLAAIASSLDQEGAEKDSSTSGLPRSVKRASVGGGGAILLVEEKRKERNGSKGQREVSEDGWGAIEVPYHEPPVSVHPSFPDRASETTPLDPSSLTHKNSTAASSIPTLPASRLRARTRTHTSSLSVTSLHTTTNAPATSSIPTSISMTQNLSSASASSTTSSSSNSTATTSRLRRPRPQSMIQPRSSLIPSASSSSSTAVAGARSGSLRRPLQPSQPRLSSRPVDTETVDEMGKESRSERGTPLLRKTSIPVVASPHYTHHFQNSPSTSTTPTKPISSLPRHVSSLSTAAASSPNSITSTTTSPNPNPNLNPNLLSTPTSTLRSKPRLTAQFTFDLLPPSPADDDPSESLLLADDEGDAWKEELSREGRGLGMDSPMATLAAGSGTGGGRKSLGGGRSLPASSPLSSQSTIEPGAPRSRPISPFIVVPAPSSQTTPSSVPTTSTTADYELQALTSRLTQSLLGQRNLASTLQEERTRADELEEKLVALSLSPSLEEFQNREEGTRQKEGERDLERSRREEEELEVEGLQRLTTELQAGKRAMAKQLQELREHVRVLENEKEDSLLQIDGLHVQLLERKRIDEELTAYRRERERAGWEEVGRRAREELNALRGERDMMTLVGGMFVRRWEVEVGR